MKTSISTILGLFILILFIGSCDDELNIEKMGNIGSDENFYKTDEDALAAISCCYYDLFSPYGFTMVSSGVMSDDLWTGGAAEGDNPEWENMCAYIHGSDNNTIEGHYTALYTMIYDANLVLEKFDNFDSQAKKQAKAEAYFFRGFAHFYLGAFFGTAPVVDHLLQPSEYAQSNSTQKQLYQQAVDDFLAAINMHSLASKANVNTPTVRITNEAAYAMLGKTYVFMEDWANAVTALDKVINSGKYELYKGNFEDILRTVSDFNNESILEVNLVHDVDNIDWSYSSYVNNFNQMHGWRTDQHNWSGLLPEYADVSNNGWGFCNPTKSIYDAFVAVEGANGYRLNQSIKTYAQVKNMGIVVKDGSKLHGHEGYYNWKMRYLESEKVTTGGWDCFNDNNLKYMRYAEVLLLAAEANLKGGSAANAASYYNEIRTRAQLPTKSTITMDDVKIEKRLELFEEGCRFLDLVRWGDAPTVLKDKGKQMMCFNGTSVEIEYTSKTSQGFVKGKHELLPIPEKEIMLNKNIKQNQGW